MPNWCNGELKVRGTKEQIKKFLLEAINPVNILGGELEKTVSEDGSWLTMKTERGSFHLKGCHRSFISTNLIEYWYPDEKDEKDVLVLEEYKSAWDVDVEGLVELSKEFSVDFKIYAFERGMCFNRDVLIEGGEIVKNETIEFENYNWDCICPSVGG